MTVGTRECCRSALAIPRLRASCYRRWGRQWVGLGAHRGRPRTPTSSLWSRWLDRGEERLALELLIILAGVIALTILLLVVFGHRWG